MFEKYLIEHCACTLASIKIANLFSFKFDNEIYLDECINQYNDLLSDKGINILVLKKSISRALIYVYRCDKLQDELKKISVQKFLKDFGYSDFYLNSCIEVLIKRMRLESFPHEIGIFLGYPVADVRCFIKNCGKNCKCIGCWKVYDNEEEALRLFERYLRCSWAYKNMYKNGKSLLELVVA